MAAETSGPEVPFSEAIPAVWWRARRDGCEHLHLVHMPGLWTHVKTALRFRRYYVRPYIVCNNNDKLHYILPCPAFHQKRAAHIDPKFTKKPNVLHMESLFKTRDALTSNLARFCSTIMDNFWGSTDRVHKVREGRADK